MTKDANTPWGTRVHFVFGGTEQAKGGGTRLWQILLRQPPREVCLHYSSYAAPLWATFVFPALRHYVHEGWTTHERAPSRFPWRNRRGFALSLIDEGDVVIFDSREAVQQLALPLAKQGARLFWHMQAKEHLLRKKLWIVPWDYLCYTRLEGCIAISEFVKKTFEGDPLYRLVGGKIPIAVLPNGIDSTFERIETEHDYVVYFGRYEGYKHPLFMEQLGCEVRYIGSKTGCAAPVDVPVERDLGWMSAEKAARYGDIFVFPAVGEAFGLAIVEMMSYGKVVIAFKSGAFPEIIDDGVDGFLVKPFDVKATVDIIRRLRAEPDLRHRISTSAIEKARRYSGEPYRERFFGIVEQIVQKGFSW